MHPSIVAILSSGLTQPPIYYTPLPNTSSIRSRSRSSSSEGLIDYHCDHHRTKRLRSSSSSPRSPTLSSSTHRQMSPIIKDTSSVPGKDIDSNKRFAGNQGGNIANDNYFMVEGPGKDQQTQTNTDQSSINAPSSPSNHYQTKQVWMISSCANPLYGAATIERPVADYCDKTIPSAGMGRALAAPSIDSPHGSAERFPLQPKPMKKARYSLWPKLSDYARDPPPGYDRTVLEQHVDFWDVDNDGIITITETFVGLRALGFSLFTSMIATFLIHSMMSYPTGESWIPDYRFRIFIKNIHRGKHGSDAEVYDTEGRFIPQKFEDLFSKFDRSRRNYLTLSDIKNLWIVDRNPFDVIGVIATVFEFGFLWLLAADEEGRLWKEDLRANYDGTLFYRIAKSRLSAAKREMDNNDQSDTSRWSFVLLFGAAMYAIIVTTLSILYIMIVQH